jgi:phage/plasmid primase-like uncharacterized protein
MAITLFGSKQNIIQVVQGTSSTAVSVSSSTYVTTGVSASITPQNTANKILVMANLTINLSSNAGNIQQGFQIRRNGTTVFTTGNKMNVNSIVDMGLQEPLVFLDSPASVSALTYEIFFAQVVSSGPYGGSTVNPSLTAPTQSIIQLFEVAYA